MGLARSVESARRLPRCGWSASTSTGVRCRLHVTTSSKTMMPSWRSEGGSPRRRRETLERREAHAIAAPASTAPASAAIPPLPPAHGEPLNRYALDPDGAPCRTSPSVELHTALVSAQIQAELEAGQHVYAKQWARPAVQWGGVQWDRSLEISIAAELFQPSALAEPF